MFYFSLQECDWGITRTNFCNLLLLTYFLLILSLFISLLFIYKHTDDQISFAMSSKKGDLDNFRTTSIDGLSMKIRPFRQCVFILDELLSCFECIEFIVPVPETATVYHQEIEHPMDFTTLEQNLFNNKYKSYQDFRQDLVLIWTNATTFHRDFDPIYKQAVVLKDKFHILEAYIFERGPKYGLMILHTYISLTFFCCCRPSFLSITIKEVDSILLQPAAEERTCLVRFPMYKEITPHRKR